MAPDLSDIGSIRPARELEQKLIDPNALVRAANRSIEIVLKDGTRVAGHLLNQDTFSIQLLDAKERLRSLAKAGIREYTYVKNSPMPSYRDSLTATELTDLVTYLVSLKGERP